MGILCQSEVFNHEPSALSQSAESSTREFLIEAASSTYQAQIAGGGSLNMGLKIAQMEETGMYALNVGKNNSRWIKFLSTSRLLERSRCVTELGDPKESEEP